MLCCVFYIKNEVQWILYTSNSHSHQCLTVKHAALIEVTWTSTEVGAPGKGCGFELPETT